MAYRRVRCQAPVAAYIWPFLLICAVAQGRRIRSGERRGLQNRK